MYLHLDHLRCERNNLHELLLTQLTSDRPEDTGTAWVIIVGTKNDSSVFVESNVGAVWTTGFLLCANDDGANPKRTLQLRNGRVSIR